MAITAEGRIGRDGASLSYESQGFLARMAGRGVGRRIGILLLLAILSFLTVYPLSMLLYGSLHSTPPGVAGVFTLDGYRDIFSQQNLLTLLNTVGIALAK